MFSQPVVITYQCALVRLFSTATEKTALRNVETTPSVPLQVKTPISTLEANVYASMEKYLIIIHLLPVCVVME